MNDETLKEAYGHLIESGSVRDGCVSPEALLAVIEGTEPETRRLATLRHVGSCARCRGELELLRVAADVGLRASRPRRAMLPALAAAAALVVVAGSVVVWQRAQGPIADTPRSVAPSEAVTLLAPTEDSLVASPVTLRWGAVEGAWRYEVEVLDPEGAPIFIHTTPDTSLVVPAAVGLAAGIEYRWWVRASLPDGSQPRSTVRRLQVRSP